MISKNGKGSDGHPALKIAALNSTFSSAIYASAPMTDKKKFSRAHNAMIRVYHHGGNVIQSLEHKGDFKQW